jgi:rSAM/selenodomain-associated transferase 2
MNLSIIIPTYNEAENIGKVVTDLLKYSAGKNIEILVIDANSSDGTAQKAQQAGATVLNAPKTGRATQMNFGATKATGDVYYFVHADVGIHPDYVADIQQALHNGYQAGCYRFKFNSSHLLLQVNSYCTRFKGLMSRGGDQTLFITQKLFTQLKGFDEHYVIMEDFDIIIRIRKITNFYIVPKDVMVSARKYQTNTWLRVQVANLTAFSMFFLKISPTRIAKTYKRMLNYR